MSQRKRTVAAPATARLAGPAPTKEETSEPSAVTARDDVRAVCYVIMPFGETTPERTEQYWTSHFERFLRPAIEEIPGVSAKRSTPLRGDIVREIINDLVISHIVLAELTDDNPNVFWELGVRQSFKHGTITICQKGPKKLPFDIGAKGTLFYEPTNHLTMADFRVQLQHAIRDCLSNPNIPDSHVLEAISGRGTLFEIFRRDEARRRLEAVMSEIEDSAEMIEAMSGHAKANQQNPAKRTFTTYRFRFSATELLVTNRYVDESRDFFAQIEEWLNEALMLNDQLNAWEHSPDDTEKWLISEESDCRRRLAKYRTLVEAAQKKLASLI